MTSKAAKTNSNIPNKSHPLPSLQQKLAKCDLEVQKHIIKLETKNADLEAEISALKTENVALNKRVKLLIKDIADYEYKSMFPEG